MLEEGRRHGEECCVLVVTYFSPYAAYTGGLEKSILTIHVVKNGCWTSVSQCIYTCLLSYDTFSPVHGGVEKRRLAVLNDVYISKDKAALKWMKLYIVYVCIDVWWALNTPLWRWDGGKMEAAVRMWLQPVEYTSLHCNRHHAMVLHVLYNRLECINMYTGVHIRVFVS